jgi:hypothetical protein
LADLQKQRGLDRPHMNHFANDGLRTPI